MRDTTALLMVDVVNAFFSPQGSMYYPDVEKTTQPLTRLLHTARERDTLVVHCVERHRPGLDDFEQHRIPVHCVAGDFDAAYFEGFTPVPRDREIELPKRRYSAFYATELDLLLREQGVNRLVVAGVKTNTCVRATVQDAFAAGYRVLLPREATNSNRPHLAEASLEDVGRYFGHTVGLGEALEAL